MAEIVKNPASTDDEISAVSLSCCPSEDVFFPFKGVLPNTVPGFPCPILLWDAAAQLPDVSGVRKLSALDRSGSLLVADVGPAI